MNIIQSFDNDTWNRFIVTGKEILKKIKNAPETKVEFETFLSQLDLSLSACYKKVCTKEIKRLDPKKLGELKGLIEEIQTISTKSFVKKIDDIQQQLKLISSGLDVHLQEVQDEPNNAEGWIALGHLYNNLGNFKAAIDVFSKAIKLNQFNIADAYYGRAVAYRMIQQFKNAKKDYLKTCELNNRNKDAFNGLGITCEALEEYQEALDYYKKALAILPPLPKALFNRGLLCLNHLKDNGQAIENLSLFLQKEPQHIQALFSRALAYLGYKDKTKDNLALTDLNKVIELDPKHLVAYLKRGAIHEINRVFDKALKDYTQTILLANHSAGYDSRKIVIDQLISGSEERKRCLYALLDQTRNLQECGLTDLDMSIVFDALQGAWGDSLFLNLTWNQLTDKGLEILIELAKKNPFVSEISYDKGIFDSEKEKVLLTQLDQNRKWQELLKQDDNTADDMWLSLLDEEKISKFHKEIDKKFDVLCDQLDKIGEDPKIHPQACYYRTQCKMLKLMNEKLERKYGSKLDRNCRKKLNDSAFIQDAKEAVSMLMNPQMKSEKRMGVFFEHYILKDVSEHLKTLQKKIYDQEDNKALIGTMFCAIYISDLKLFNQLKDEILKIEKEIVNQLQTLNKSFFGQDMDQQSKARLEELNICFDRITLLKTRASDISLHLLKWSERKKEVFELFEKMASEKNAEAYYELGRLHEGAEEGLTWFIEAAKLGHSESQYQVYVHLKKMGNDEEEAIVWLKKAAAQKHREALVGLNLLLSGPERPSTGLPVY